MKRPYPFILILIIFSISCQNIEKPGPVAEYSFNGNALDESGNDNHAVVHGARLTSDRFGNENAAYYFDGSSGYIEALVSNMPAVEDPQTIACWFMIDQPPGYPDSLGADGMISLVDSAADIGVQFGYRAPGYHTLGLDVWYWGGRTVLETDQPQLNKWHHIAYTFDGKTHRFYLDGQQKAQSVVKPQHGTPKMLMFGNYPGGDQFFRGSMDEVCIYTRALPSAEIELLYNKKE